MLRLFIFYSNDLNYSLHTIAILRKYKEEQDDTRNVITKNNAHA